MRRIWFLTLIGGLGLAILLSLGFWQLQRLSWKESVLAGIAARMEDPLAALPPTPSEARDEYRLIRLDGEIGAGALHVLTSRKPEGPGYRVIAPFDLGDGRRVLLDRGFIAERDKDAPHPGGTATVTGNLLWPDDVNSFTPEPNLDRNIWFAREVGPMARALGTEPVMVVARSNTGGGVSPMPVTLNIANDHLEYALTWFGLAAGWLGMSLYFARRMRRR